MLCLSQIHTLCYRKAMKHRHSLCQTRIGVLHRHIWLHWIMSFSHTIIYARVLSVVHSRKVRNVGKKLNKSFFPVTDLFIDILLSNGPHWKINLGQSAGRVWARNCHTRWTEGTKSRPNFDHILYWFWWVSVSGGARKNIAGGPAKYTLIYKHKLKSCKKKHKIK